MDSVAKRIEDGGDLQVNPGMVPPDVGHGQRDQLGKGSCAIDPDALCRCTKMPSAGSSVRAPATDDVTLSTDDVPGMKIVDVGADGDDLSYKLMADGHGYLDRPLCPFIPLEDVDVRSTDSGLKHTNQDVINPDRWFGNVFEPEAAFCSTLDQRFHGTLRPQTGLF